MRFNTTFCSFCSGLLLGHPVCRICSLVVFLLSNCVFRSIAAVAALSLRQRLHARHAFTTMSPPGDVIATDVADGGHVTPAEVERVRLFYSSLESRVCRKYSTLSSRSAQFCGARCDWMLFVVFLPIAVIRVVVTSRRVNVAQTI